MSIYTLTQDQKSRFSEFREKWIQIGLSTAPADRPTAKEGIRIAYSAVGLRPPHVVWCGSPLAQGLTQALVRQVWQSAGESVGRSIGQSVVESVGQSVRQSVRQSAGESVIQSVIESVGQSIWQSVIQSVGQSVRQSVVESVGQSVLESVGQSVRQSVIQSVGQSVGQSIWRSVVESVGQSVGQSVESVGQSVLESIGQSVIESVGKSGYGQHDASWLGFYDYFRQVCGLKRQTEKLTGLMQYAQSAGWFLPYENVCWVSERHSILTRDEAGRLHNRTGPALAYPDGWAIYAVHGTRVPSAVIEHQELITVETIDNEPNAEVRRVMLDLFGLDKYLLAGKTIDMMGDYRLLVKSHGGRNMVALIMRCPTTAAVYVHPVHPSVQTVDQALAWKRGHDNFSTTTTYKEGLIWEK